MNDLVLDALNVKCVFNTRCLQYLPKEFLLLSFNVIMFDFTLQKPLSFTFNKSHSTAI